MGPDRIGADADHLKTPKDVDATAEAGFTFFTIDPSDHVDAHADDYDEADPSVEKFEAVAAEIEWIGEVSRPSRSDWRLAHRRSSLTKQACLRAAVKYGRAIHHAFEAGRAYQRP